MKADARGAIQNHLSGFLPWQSRPDDEDKVGPAPLSKRVPRLSVYTMILSRFVRTLPPALLPILRSDRQGEILALLLLLPANEHSLSDIQRRVHREVTRLLAGGVLLERTVGRSRLVRTNPDYSLLRPLTEMIQATYGPVPVLTQLLRNQPGIREAYIFGSWAARRAGMSGPPPRDIDVLVVGDTPQRDLYSLGKAAGKELGQEVNFTRIDPVAWLDQTDSFVKTVRSRPMTVIPVHQGGEE
jgi:predicted nucleotidyltransferase